MQDRRRIGGNLYDYNYAVVQSAGFKAKIQHNQTWFKTWGIVSSWDRPLVIGWKDMLFEVKIPGMKDIEQPVNPIYTNAELNYSQYALSLDLKKYPLAMVDGNASDIKHIISKKETFTRSDLNKLIDLFNERKLVPGLINTQADGFMVDVTSQNIRYIYLAKNEKSAVSREISQVFIKNTPSFNIDMSKIKFSEPLKTAVYLLETLKRSYDMKDFRLVYGTAYTYTPNDSGGYAGMIVKKFED